MLDIFFLMISLLSLICASMFCFMKHPLAMGLMLLIQTLLVSLMTGLTTKSFWFSYILFIILLGGLLVLFIYVTSLAANEMFVFSMKMFTYSMSLIFSLSLFLLFLDKNLTMINMMKSIEIESSMYQKSFLHDNSLILTKLYNFPVNLITISMMIYLFLTLVAIVKITNVFDGPLRPKM